MQVDLRHIIHHSCVACCVGLRCESALVNHVTRVTSTKFLKSVSDAPRDTLSATQATVTDSLDHNTPRHDSVQPIKQQLRRNTTAVCVASPLSAHVHPTIKMALRASQSSLCVGSKRSVRSGMWVDLSSACQKPSLPPQPTFPHCIRALKQI